MNEIHSRSYDPEYRHWVNMKSRCNTPSSTGWESYGGRGIKVCDRWNSSFLAFLEDMGPKPGKGYSVDRIDVNGDYEPGNCRWATSTQQGRNMRNNRIVSTPDGPKVLSEAIAISPVPYNTVLYRLRRGWTEHDALTRKAHKGVRP